MGVRSQVFIYKLTALRSLLPILIFLFVLSCANIPFSFIGNKAPAETPPPFFSSLPNEKGLVFIGSTGKRSNQKEALLLALEDAARQVAVFQRVSGEFIVVNNIGSGAFDYEHETFTSIHYDAEGSIKFIEQLQFNIDKDTLETENTFFVRTTFSSALPSPLSYKPAHSDTRKPEWVKPPPLDINGYEVGIGYSGRYSSLSDTYNNSRRNAIFDIIRKINSVSKSSSLLYQNTSSLFGYKTMNNNTIQSYGTLTGFYVLDTWLDPETKAVWSLAVAVKP